MQRMLFIRCASTENMVCYYRYLLVTISVLFHACLFNVALTSAASAGEHTPADEIFNDDNLLIVDIVLGQYRLAGDVFIYSSPELTVVPLQAFFDAVEFPILVDPVAKKANGWFLRESNHFDLNVDERRLLIGNEEIPLPADAILESDGFDLYVELTILQSWLAVQVQLDISRLRLLINSEQPLPVEQQLAREKARQRNLVSSGAAGVPLVADRYRMLGVPVVDINVGSLLRDKPDSSNIDSDLSYSLQSSMDLLGLQSSLSLSRSSLDSNTRERLTLWRKPVLPEQDIVAGLSDIAFGDVFGISNPLVFNGGEGLGADFQFGGSRSNSDFGKRIIEGEATPGWEVELYRNNALIDFQLVGDDGRYRFEDISVEYGENIFDVRLFGPQGQEQSRREIIRVGEQSLAKGKTYARLSYVNLDKNVFDSDTNTAGQPDGGDEEQLLLNLQAGLSERVSATLSYNRHNNLSASIDKREYAELGLYAAIGDAAVGLLHSEQLQGGRADLLSVQSRLGNTSISYLHKHYYQFQSDRSNLGLLQDDIELRLTGHASVFDWRPVAYQLTGNYLEDVNGSYSYNVENRLGVPFYNGRLTLETDYADNQFSEARLAGKLRYLKSVGSKTNLRAAIDYKIEPDAELTGGSGSITWRATENFRTQLSINSDFIGNDNNSLGISLSYIFDRLTLSANTTLQEGGNSSFLLNAEFSLGRENRKQWRVRSQPQSTTGRLQAKVFLDNDADGQFSPGDEPLPGVKFEGLRSWEHKVTDANGEVFLTGLRSETPTRITLDQGSLEDPYWRSRYDEKAFVSHAGGLHKIAVPIVATVEVEGSLSLKKGDTLKPLAGIPIIIEGLDSSFTKRIATEFDGFFVAAGIMPGRYQLKIDQQALEKLKLQQPAPVYFVADADTGIVHLDPLILIAGTTSSQSANDPLPVNNTLVTEKKAVIPVAAKVQGDDLTSP